MNVLKTDLAEFGGLFNTAPADLAAQELLSMDFILHRAWAMKRAGHPVYQTGGREWQIPDILNLHAEVCAEMALRGFAHTLNDELDAETRRHTEMDDPDAPDDPLAAADKPRSFVMRAIVTRVEDGYLPETRNVYFGLDYQNMKAAPEPIRSLNGKLWLEIGHAAGAGPWPEPGDILDVECESLILCRRDDGNFALSAAGLDITSVPGSKPVMTVGETLKTARAAGLLRETDVWHFVTEYMKGVRQAFGSYGGKRFLAHKIASYIPYHKTYVEPFAGGAAVLYAKDPSPQEVLNDRDAEIAFMHKFIRDHSPEDRSALAKRDWVIRQETHERLKELKPSTDRDRFYKSFYLTRSSYGKMRGGSFNHANAGVRIDFPANIERAQARLKNAAVHNKDYRDILKDYDGQDTFFYMDPPYPGKFNLFDFGFDDAEFKRAIKSLKAKWIVSYPVEQADSFKGYNVYKVRRRNQMRGPGGNQEWVTEILVSNFPLQKVDLYIGKELDIAPEGFESEEPELLPHLEDQSEVEKIRGAFKSPGGKLRLCKKLVGFLPEHKNYVEAFCGGAQVLFHKKRSDIEIINDVNSDIIASYRFIKGMTTADWEWLKKRDWIISRALVKKLYEWRPETTREKFYRFAYLNKATYWGRADAREGVRRHGSSGEGAKIHLAERLPEIQERLKGVLLHSWDWQDAVKEYDSKDTLFYLDPPYPLHWPKEAGRHGSKFFQEESLLPALRAIRGKFLLSYELEKEKLFKEFNTYRVKTLWTGMHQLGSRTKYELLVSNYELKPGDLYSEKALAGSIQPAPDGK